MRLTAATFKDQNQVFCENIPNVLWKVSTDVWFGAKKTGLQIFETCWVYRWKWSEMRSLSCVRLFVTPWAVAHQTPQSMGFSRQEYWSGLPLPSPVFSTNSHKTLVHQATPGKHSLSLNHWEEHTFLLIIQMFITMGIISSPFLFLWNNYLRYYVLG